MYLATLFLLLLLPLPGHGGITCKDNSNKPVDWFALYKLPVEFNSSSNKHWPFPPHLYMDANNNQFQLSKQNLNESTQAVAYTLQQAYDNHKSSDVGYIIYNDEKPTEAGGGWTESYGHTKGVTIFDSDSGIWLVHSVPKFPPPTNSSYMFPDNAVYYGQHMLCIQLDTSADVANTGTLLMYNEPWIYDANLPQSLKEAYPIMAKVIAEERTTETSTVIKLSATSHSYIAFAKNRHFDADLYAKLVAPSLACNLTTETWQHGDTENLPSVCNQTYTVENIKGIQSKAYGITFDNYYDHSKFALCKGKIPDVMAYVCIGDVNRQTHQTVRGGGTVCLNNLEVHAQYSSLVRQLETCPV